MNSVHEIVFKEKWNCLVNKKKKEKKGALCGQVLSTKS
jgi:hypothetical protein